MSIDRDLVNVTDLAVHRPDRSGPGGDTVGTPTPVYTGLEAVYEPRSDLRRTVDNREMQITARFYVDLEDADGEVIDIRAGDLLEYTDHAGRSSGQLEIRWVKAFKGDPDLAHQVLELGN